MNMNAWGLSSHQAAQSATYKRTELIMTDQDEHCEVDCPWFDPKWLLDHPYFPLATTVVGENDTKEDN